MELSIFKKKKKWSGLFPSYFILFIREMELFISWLVLKYGVVYFVIHFGGFSIIQNVRNKLEIFCLNIVIGY